jgi:hypothetical protein
MKDYKNIIPNCFEFKGNAKKTSGLTDGLKASANQARKLQLFIRAITDGVLSERDLLLNYTVAEFYNEQSLFIEEQEKIKQELEKNKVKKK